MISTYFTKNSRIFMFLFLTTTVLTACNAGDERYEVVTKLRALGVEADPFVTAPSPIGNPTTATLTFLAAVPPDQTVTAETFSDENSQFSKAIPLTLVAGSESYEDREKFRIFSVKATTTIPAADSVLIPKLPGFVTFRYGMKLTSEGGEEEKIVGNIVVFSNDKEELAWKDTPPSVQIDNLTAGQTVGEHVDLKGQILSSNDEKFKISWFVSSGEVKNKRAAETSWDKIAKGPQTIILTARGKTTAAFAWAAVDVIVE
jgi:hypothetical protein